MALFEGFPEKNNLKYLTGAIMSNVSTASISPRSL